MSDLAVSYPTAPVLLGDRFELVVSGASPQQASVQIELPEGLDALEIGPAVVRREDGRFFLSQPLRALHEGEVTMKDVTVVLGGERIALPPIELNVTLDVPADRAPRVAGRLPPDELPAAFPWLPLLIALALALAALAIWLRRRKPEPAAPVRFPDVLAAEALAALRSRLPSSPEEVPPFVDEVSAILRRYVEQVFHVAAPERTTEEFLAELSGRSDPLGERRAVLARFLSQCDLIKFAADRPLPSAVVGLLDIAEAFVDETHVPAEAAA